MSDEPTPTTTSTPEQAPGEGAQDAPARRRRADDPTWQKIEAVGKAYFTACRRAASLLSRLRERRQRE